MSAATVLAYLASAMLIVWGTAHLVPTRAVTASFGAISLDNRRILVMEWVAEGITHISIALIIILATAIDGASNATTQLLYLATAGFLLALAGLTAITGARTAVIWFRVCRFILTASTTLLALAVLL